MGFRATATRRPLCGLHLGSFPFLPPETAKDIKAPVLSSSGSGKKDSSYWIFVLSAEGPQTTKSPEVHIVVWVLDSFFVSSLNPKPSVLYGCVFIRFSRDFIRSPGRVLEFKGLSLRLVQGLLS